MSSRQTQQPKTSSVKHKHCCAVANWLQTRRATDCQTREKSRPTLPELFAHALNWVGASALSQDEVVPFSTDTNALSLNNALL